MGARGPIPKPNRVRLLEGKPGHRPLRRELKAPPHVPPQPRWIELLPGGDAEARRVRSDAASCWRHLARELDLLGLVGRIDATLIQDYAVEYARLLQVERIISRDGLTQDGPTGTVRHPLFVVAGQLRTALAKRMGLLGIGATSRARLSVPEPVNDQRPTDLFD